GAVDPCGAAKARAGGKTKRFVGKARPGAGMRSPRWRAERRHAPEMVRALKIGCADRRAVPLLFRRKRKKTGLPGPRQRIGAMTLALRVPGKPGTRGVG